MTIIRDACPHCEARRDVEVVRRRETTKIRGEDVEFESEYMVCTSCGKDYADAVQMDAALEAARAVYRARHGIIGPAELVALRARYDASQKAFARILDIGDLTINTYEQGVLPSGAHNSLLRLAELPDNFARLFDANKGSLTERQRAKIEGALGRLLPARREAAEAREATPVYAVRESGGADRLLQMAQLIIALAASDLYKMALLKLLFYADFSYFRRTGHSISGWRYARLPYGPVPDDFKSLLCKGEEEGYFVLEMDDEELGDRMHLPEGFDLDRVKADFSPSELEVITLVAEKLGRLKASSLRDMSHEEKGWIETEASGIIPWDYAKCLVHGV